MHRTVLPLVLIVLVLFGAWWIWPRPEPRAPLDPAATASQSAPPRGETNPAVVDVAQPSAERADAAPPAPAAPETRLVVRCISRNDQRPLDGVRVRVVQGVATRGVKGTGVDGRASFPVRAGSALAVAAEDYARHVSAESTEVPALAEGETREVTLLHDAGEHAHLCGLVVAREGGAPVAGAQISIEGAPRAQTDAAGRFELDFAAHLPPWLRVDAPGFAPALASAEANHETPAQARRIELLRPASLEVVLLSFGAEARMRAELYGKARELAQEGAFTSGWRDPEPISYGADADDKGVCRFEALPPGVRFEAQLTATSAVLYRSSEPIVLQPGEQRRVEWDLGGAAIVGRVVESDGSPAPGVELVLQRDADYVRYVDAQVRAQDLVGSAKSGADGSFRFPRVSPGAWLLAPKGTSEIAGAPQRVEVEGGAREVAVEVRLARGLFVRGRLVAPDGQTGLQGLVALAGPIHAGTSSQPDGSFVLGPLAPGRVALQGHPYGDFQSTEPFEVEPPAQDVRLVARPGAEIAGRVVDELGNGVQAAITVGTPNGGMTITRTQGDGSFRLTGLAAGTCALFASTSDGRAGLLEGVRLSPEQPSANLEVVLHPGATLRVRYEGSGVVQVAFKRGGSTIGGDGLENGGSLTQVVPAGSLTVECTGPGRDEKQQQEASLAVGETRELVFRPLAK